MHCMAIKFPPFGHYLNPIPFFLEEGDFKGFPVSSVTPLFGAGLLN